MNRGVLYVVVGSERYNEAFLRSAASLRMAMPSIPIAVASRGDVALPDAKSLEIAESDGYRAKIIAMQGSPFEQTILLDVDTYVAGDLTEIFDLLDQFDMALAHAPGRMTVAFDDVPDSFPEFNTGVIAWKANERVSGVVADWLKEYDQLLPLEPLSCDQPALRRCLYRASQLRLATLPQEFNQRFTLAGFQCQPLRILHGWPADGVSLEEVAESLKHGVEPGTFRSENFRAFVGQRLYDASGRCIADWTQPRTRGNALKSRLRGLCGRQ